MKILKNRTMLGLACIVLSLLICFGLTPILNGVLKSQTEIVRISSDIKKGETITPDRVEKVKVGGFNLPGNVIKKQEEVVGKYAKADMQKGDYILSTKLSDTPLTEFEYLSKLDGKKQAMSITIKTFAAGLSGKLETGDVVSIISAEFGEMRTTVVPSELQYVEVLAATLDNGLDKEYNSQPQKKDDKKELPSTLTLLVTPEQAKILAELEAKGKIHATLVYRGSKENANAFLKKQDEFLQKQNKKTVQGEKTNGQQ